MHSCVSFSIFLHLENQKVATITERAGLSGSTIPFFVSIASLPVYDLIFGFYNLNVGSTEMIAARINETHFVASLFIPSPGKHAISLHYKTLHQNTSIQIIAPGIIFASWSRHTMFSISPYFNLYTNNFATQFVASIVASAITEANGLNCVAQTALMQITTVAQRVQLSTVECNFTLLFSNDTMNVDIYLALDTGSLDPKRKFIVLSENNITSAFVRSPLQLQTSLVTESTASSLRSLSFVTPTARTKQIYEVRAKVIGAEYSVLLPCNFTYDAIPFCSFSNFIAPTVPSQLHLTLRVQAFVPPTLVVLNSIFYWQNSSVVFVQPFLADMTQALPITITVAYPLNSMFSFFCVGMSTSYVINIL